MSIDFGQGPTLRDAFVWLQDERRVHEQILAVTERDSVIEGLPALDPEGRSRILTALEQLASLRRARRQ